MNIEQKIARIELLKQQGFIATKEVSDVKKWMDYANTNSEEDMELFRRAKEALRK